MDNLWFRPLVWMDYRLAVVFTVILPLILLIWSLKSQIESISRLLIIYWRVASLLMITVYLMIPSWSYGFLTSWAARILIPLSLWFWVDINDEIKDLPPTPLKLAITAWRWAVTFYSLLGAIAFIPFLACGLSDTTVKQPFCQVWLQPPWQFQSIFHRDTDPGVLGFMGMVGLIFYTIYFAYFLCIRLGRLGRSALEQ
jgi:hypothetical protein